MAFGQPLQQRGLLPLAQELVRLRLKLIRGNAPDAAPLVDGFQMVTELAAVRP